MSGKGGPEVRNQNMVGKTSVKDLEKRGGTLKLKTFWALRGGNIGQALGS